jgi:hypothetical protein
MIKLGSRSMILCRFGLYLRATSLIVWCFIVNLCSLIINKIMKDYWFLVMFCYEAQKLFIAMDGSYGV